MVEVRQLFAGRRDVCMRERRADDAGPFVAGSAREHRAVGSDHTRLAIVVDARAIEEFVSDLVGANNRQPIFPCVGAQFADEEIHIVAPAARDGNEDEIRTGRTQRAPAFWEAAVVADGGSSPTGR